MKQKLGRRRCASETPIGADEVKEKETGSEACREDSSYEGRLASDVLRNVKSMLAAGPATGSLADAVSMRGASRSMKQLG